MHVFGGATWFNYSLWTNRLMILEGGYNAVILFTQFFGVLIFIVFLLDYFVLSHREKQFIDRSAKTESLQRLDKI